ncbi:glycosyltransferase family A protein [Gorillibacterium sp. CAU 1737]|uniref:glycosyltransferase family 2 protein n=1 Tax=Gorillibacterium sp. CAU 1737 TaxID=3140362 RepID=UPI003261CE2F
MKDGDNMPLISVIVTVYNLENYIAQCLESLVRQDFSDFEIVIVDNGSTDSSCEICLSYVRKYPMLINYISLDRPSVMHRGHREGIRAAQGTYLHIIDGDDYVRDGYLQEAAAIIREQEPDVIIGRYTSFTEGEALPSRDAILDRKQIEYHPDQEVIGYIRTLPSYHLAFWRYIFKGAMMDKDRLFYSHFKENAEFPLLDALVTFRILLAANTFSLIEMPLYYYRHRENSMSAPNPKQRLWSVQSFFEFRMLLQSKEITGEKQKFIVDKLNQDLKLSIGQSDLWKDEELRFICTLLEKVKKHLEIQIESETSVMLQRFQDWLMSVEVNVPSVASYFSSERELIVSNISKKNAGDVFICPCGRYAQSIQRWLLQDGRQRRISFLDNNPDMSGKYVNGSECFGMGTINRTGESFQPPPFFLIASIHDELDKLLYKQCLDLGVPNESILIC